MHNLQKTLGSISSMLAMAILGSACGAEGYEPDKPLGDSEASADEFEYVPAAEASDTSVAEMKAAKEDELYAKGSATVQRATTVYRALRLEPGDSVSAQTGRGGGPSVDTVLVLFQHFDNATALVPGYSTEVRAINVLAFNDDSGGSYYSSLGYTNNTNSTINTWLLGFGYGSSVGFAELYYSCKHGDFIVHDAPFSAGSVKGRATQTYAYTTSSTPINADPVLFAFPYGTGTGRFNDDSGGGGLESYITGLTNGATYIYMPFAYFQSPSGSSLVVY